MDYRTIETELREGLLIIRQSRPEVLNARNQAMHAELILALRAADLDDGVAAVLLTGKGRFFCAGTDLKARSAAAVGRDDHPSALQQVSSELPPFRPHDPDTWIATAFVRAFIDFSKPLIGGANGPAVGEGFTSLLHCDTVLAAQGAYFWAPFARIGAVPEFCSTILAPQRLGASLGHEMLYFSRRIEVDEAHRVGFVAGILAAGADFEARAVDRILPGLALAGPPELRASTLKRFRSLVRGPNLRRTLMAQCRREMSLLAERRVSGEAQRVREYYAEQLPRR